MMADLAPHFYLSRSFGNVKYTGNLGTEVWLFHEVCTVEGASKYDGVANATPGADCISTVGFAERVWKMVGAPKPGKANLYIAFYKTAAAPDRPMRAVEGTLASTKDGVTTYTISGGQHQTYGVPSTPGVLANHFLQFTDSSCVDAANPNAAAGTAGCGPKGFNSFEGTFVVEVSPTETWYFPGGTTKSYKNDNKVLTVFKTLAWAEEKMVMNKLQKSVAIVDYTYAPANSDEP